MIDKLIIAFLSAVSLVILGSVGWLGYWLSQQDVDWLKTADLRVLITAGAAFLGFFGGTFIKFALDYCLERIKGHSQRRQLAKELLAELRYISSELERQRRRLNTEAEMQGEMANYEENPEDAEEPVFEVRKRTTAELDRIISFPSTDVYDASIGRLGLLDGTLAALVIETFSSVKSLEREKTPWSLSERVLDYIETVWILQGVKTRIIWVLSKRIEKLDAALANLTGVEPETYQALVHRTFPGIAAIEEAGKKGDLMDLLLDSTSK